jgi:hypothetical protein
VARHYSLDPHPRIVNQLAELREKEFSGRRYRSYFHRKSSFYDLSPFALPQEP